MWQDRQQQDTVSEYAMPESDRPTRHRWINSGCISEELNRMKYAHSSDIQRSTKHRAEQQTMEQQDGWLEMQIRRQGIR